MKKLIIYLLAISFLMQSCYSYKNIDFGKTELKIGKKYKIKEGDKFVKVKLKKISDSTVTVAIGKKIKEIKPSEIIKEQKISYWKTIVVTTFVISFIAIIVALTRFQQTSYGGNYQNPI